MPKTAVLYARYSSDKQREASIDDQLRVCRGFCEAEGIGVLREYADRALSGKTDRRPEFRRMMANAPESDYVVVYTFDRFSRDRYDAATYKKALRECGVRVVSATEKVEDTPEGGLQEGLLEILSEYYVADLARKVRRGMEGNALKARDNGCRIFGYSTDPETRRYVVDEREAEAVRGMFSRYMGGESIYAIASSMAADGWTTSTGSPVDYNWVWRVLNRRAYTGLYSWGGIEVEGGMPVIIDEGTFAKAAAMPKRKPRKNEEWAVYRLTGKLFCGLCGMPMHGYGGTGKQGRRYYYYGCRESGGCGRPGTRRELVEDALADAVMDITADEKRMRMVARRVVEAYGAGDGARAEIAACEARIAALERERHNLTKAARMGFVNDEAVSRNEEIGALLRGLHNRRGILMSEAGGVTEDEIVEFLAHGFDRADEDFIFGSFTNKVYLFDDCLLAVFSFRDEVGGLAEVRVSLERHLRKNANPEGFASLSPGVSGNTNVETLVMPGGIGLLVPLRKSA